jgi:hypothetical protein
MCGGVRVWRSRRRGSISRERGSDVIGRRAVAQNLVSWLCVLRKVVVSSALLCKSVTIGHLKQLLGDQWEALAQGNEHKPVKSIGGFEGGLGWWCGERGSDLASLAHRSAGEVLRASTTFGEQNARRTQRSSEFMCLDGGTFGESLLAGGHGMTSASGSRVVNLIQGSGGRRRFYLTCQPV